MEKDSSYLPYDRPCEDLYATRPSNQHNGLRYRIKIGLLGLFVLPAFIWLWLWPLSFPPSQHCSGKLTIEQRANKILTENPLIDGHNDLLIFLRYAYNNHIYSKSFQTKFEKGSLEQHVDLPRLDKGKQGGAFWSAFMPCPSGNGTDFSTRHYDSIVRATLDQIDLFNRLGSRYPKYFTPAFNHAEALQAFERGRLISPLAIEGLHQIGNSVSTLRLYHSLGVRYATLTWNCHNAYADAALESDANMEPRVAVPYWGGLSPAGIDAVVEMNRMGMIVDLSHVSKDTMKDVLIGPDNGDFAGSLAPPIFSHSSAYSICPHPRNVPDDVLQMVKKRNSLVMVNFSPSFISCVPSNSSNSSSGLPDFYPPNATLHQVVRHIRYIGELIGYDHVGIGTDFDGIDSTPVGLEDVSKFPDLVAELLKQGVTDGDVAKVVGRNLLRVWKEVDEVAEKLQRSIPPLEDEVRNPWV
ncbi:hypothetical protein GQ43DRAFT_417184 [Delitschia confertaspora ATCC 74209]|uniref:Dipeptidase n=1 Tax=Delitschia confertaspora ATCC 74209 TaxID=1513339 RepID=A0A9P4MSB1_9PLEO|nr:hypothetical protein GQ43DRAFT_417184 [Delitschia confertaspora ATCC 74209]